MKLKRRGKNKGINEKSVGEIVKSELADYIKREDLKAYLQEIESDKKKKALWESLPAHKKLKVLRYAIKREGEARGKK